MDPLTVVTHQISSSRLTVVCDHSALDILTVIENQILIVIDKGP
jgi:hypothetical protein